MSVRRILLAVLVLAAAGLAAYLWLPRRPQPTPAPSGPTDSPPVNDPRRTFDTPFKNVRPEVAYVGDVACLPCHKDLCDSYHQHPMGRSAALWGQGERVEQFGPTAQPTFTTDRGTKYRVEVKDDRLWQTELLAGPNGKAVADTSAEAQVVIGSGHQARSYLCVRDGSVWQTGTTWFSTRHRWDVSPGFVPGRHANRAVNEACFHCHVDQVDPVPGTINRYREPLFPRQAAIGCERCHGPGALHVDERTAGRVPEGAVDLNIVNPKHLTPDLRDSVCQQCHLQGKHRVPRRGLALFDYRPGLPLELVHAVFVEAATDPEHLQFVGHVEQMAASRCAVASGGKLACTSCHDPHRDPPPAAREQFFRQACLKCHADRGCSLPVAERQAKRDDCAACHMPRGSAEVSHTSVTDHRIPRRPTAKGKPSGPPAVGLPIREYHADSKHGPRAEERERDLGVALAYLVQVEGNRDQRVRDAALDLLVRATGRFPSDGVAWESLSYVRAARGEWDEALEAITKSLAAQPDQESALQHGAAVARRARDPVQGLAWARRVVELNPGSAIGRVNLGLALVDARDWSAAADALRAGLRDMPANAGGRAGLAVCLFQLGDRSAAQAELDRAAALAPEQDAAIRSWYRERTQ